MKKKITVGIALYITNELHVDFTRQTLESIKTIHDTDIVLVSNYIKDEFRDEVQKLTEQYQGVLLINPVGNCVSEAWNIAIEHAIKNNHDYVLLPNNDIVFHRFAIDNLVEFAQRHPEFILWTANTHENLRTLSSAELGTSFDEHPHFSCFMMSPDGVKKLQEKEQGTTEPRPGFFDKGFDAAYFEDNDMHQRIIRAGFKAGKTASSLFYHYGSRTIKVDDDLFLHNRITYEENRQYFKRKWGFDPHDAAIENDSEVRFAYKQPFDGIQDK